MAATDQAISNVRLPIRGYQPRSRVAARSAEWPAYVEEARREN